MSQVNALPRMGTYLEKHPDVVGGAGKSTTTNYNKNDKVADKIDLSHGETPELYKKTTLEQTEKPYIVTCPLDQSTVTHVKSITRDNTIFYEVTIEDANQMGVMIFHYLSQSYVYKKQNITKSYPIGVSSKYFYISSKGANSQKAAQDFEKFTNEQAQNNYNDTRYIMKNMSEKEKDKIYDQNQKLGEQYYKNARSVLGRGGETPVHKENAYPTTNVNTQPTDNLNSANKNVTSAVQNVDQGKSTPESTKPQPEKQSTETLALNAPSSSSSNVMKNYDKSVAQAINSGMIGNQITVG